MFRSGNVHSADRWKVLLEPIVQRYENRKVRKYFRGDAAFAKPEIYEYLEEKGLLYAIRLPANDVLYNVESKYNKPFLNYGKRCVRIGLQISIIKNILFKKMIWGISD